MNGNRAASAAMLRGLAAAYLLYLGWTILRDLFRGASSLPLWMGWAAGLGFAAAGLAFGWYSIRSYRRAQQSAQAKKDGREGEEP